MQDISSDFLLKILIALTKNSHECFEKLNLENIHVLLPQHCDALTQFFSGNYTVAAAAGG